MSLKRENCWLTFSEALKLYLDSRDAIGRYGPGRNRENAIHDMELAAAHMDALTELPTAQSPT